jgi:hypothetical protein
MSEWYIDTDISREDFGLLSRSFLEDHGRTSRKISIFTALSEIG